MSATKLRLLRAACDTAGGTRPLADHLGISEAILRKYVSGGLEPPDGLFLRAVDFILAHRDAHIPVVLPGDIAPREQASDI